MRKSKIKLSFLLVFVLLIGVFAMTSCDQLAAYIPGLGGGDVTDETPDAGNNEQPDDTTDKPGDTTETPDDTPEECDHIWANSVDIKVPICGTLQTGITESTCRLCGKVQQETFEAYYEHIYDEDITPATCYDYGRSVEVCRICSFRSENIIPKLKHDYQLTRIPNTDGLCGVACIYCYDVEKYVSLVKYEDYGAVGDGVTDDSDAIRRAHVAANSCGLPVEAKAGATYYIGKISSTIPIMTDTNWNGAHFIFDDSQIMWNDSYHRAIQVFSIWSDYSSRKIEVPLDYSLKKGQTNIGMTFDEPCMLKIVNASEKIFIRYGENANSGASKYELILVDENGNVDPSTPIQYDYKLVTSMTAYSINDTPITVGNATITTIVPNPKEQDPNYENNYCFYYRGIRISRSNATVSNIEHKLVGEDMTIEIDRNGDGRIDKWGDDKSYGVPYNGFFSITGCANATLTDTIVQGHQAYSFWQGSGSSLARNEMGSYEIYATDCVNLNLLNLTQYENEATGEVITNRFMYHGIMGSNFCRNIVMDNCYLDRFDAHQGMHNATITNSTLGFGILVIGGGTLHIENVYRVGSGNVDASKPGPFILLRTDYNSVFDGDLVIKNCRMGPYVDHIVSGQWRSFYNGLPNYMFRSITIDGLIVESKNTSISVYNVNAAGVNALTDSINKLYLPDTIKVRGVVNANGRSVSVSSTRVNGDAFAQVKVTKLEDED